MKYLIIFLISMVPIIELRGAMVYAVAYELPYIPALITCVIGNMLPVPIIYFFARKVLVWGSDKKHIGKIFTFFLEKFIALLLFVGIPIPGTGAWTGTLGASFLNMGFKSTVVAVSLGVVLAGIIMALLSTGVFAVIGL